MNTQRLEIQRIPYTQMLKSEVSQLAQKTIHIVQSHTPKELLIEPLLEKLEALMPDVETMSFNYGIDPERLKIKNLKSTLMLTISALKLEVRILEKLGIDDDLHLINSFIDGNLRGLSKVKNDKVLTERINGFLHALETEEALSEAIEEKALMAKVDAIKLALRAFKSALAKRVTLLAERPKYNTAHIVSNVVVALEDLFKTIDVFHMTNTELDYTALIEELNQQARMYRRSINIRLANNLRKAEAKKKGETDIEGVEDETPTDEQTPETSNYSAYSSSEPCYLTNDEED